MNKIKILAIDDDRPKLDTLVDVLQSSEGINGGGKDGVPASRFVPQGLIVGDALSLDEVVSRALCFDCAIVDYMLGSEANIPFNGVAVIDSILRQHKNFPVFLFTSHRDDVFSKEIIDVCHVFDFDEFLEGDEYSREVNRTIVRQVINHTREQEAWERELLDRLLSKKTGDVDSDERILELDTWIEQCTVRGKGLLSRRAKRDLADSKIDYIIESIDKVLKS